MSDEEKKSVKGWEEMGGYLKTLDFKEACRVWWKENPIEHERFTSLPNFSWSLFTEITGIESGNGKKEELLKKADELISKANELKKEAEKF